MSTVPTQRIDLSAMSFWAKPWTERLDAFRHLRDHDPVSWQDPPEALAPGLDNVKGYWAIARAEDIRELSRNTEVFSSAEGVFVDDFPALETILSFLVMDAPRHGQLRGIVASAFTPKHIRKMEDQIRAEAAARSSTRSCTSARPTCARSCSSSCPGGSSPTSWASTTTRPGRSSSRAPSSSAPGSTPSTPTSAPR